MSISEAEFSIMELIWANGGTMQAKDIAVSLNRSIALSATTVYTMISRLIKKNVISRVDPGFYCTANISKEEVMQKDTDRLITKLYDGSVYDLILYCIKTDRLSENEKIRLKRLVKDL